MPATLVTKSPELARLVERQMRNWELARLQRRGRSPAVETAVEDFVCISRQVGLDGVDIAQRVGGELSWSVFDREILEAMAGDDALRRRIYESMDQRDLGWWEETLRSLLDSEFRRNDYFRRLSEAVLSLARQGSCVFLGRGADLLLPRDLGFRVRLVAPLEFRIRAFGRNKGLATDEAQRQMRLVERERSRFFRHHFGVEAEDPSRYDLTINVERLCGDRAARLVLAGRRIYQSKS